VLRDLRVGENDFIFVSYVWNLLLLLLEEVNEDMACQAEEHCEEEHDP
jgi:hypothetical protein